MAAILNGVNQKWISCRCPFSDYFLNVSFKFIQWFVRYLDNRQIHKHMLMQRHGRMIKTSPSNMEIISQKSDKCWFSSYCGHWESLVKVKDYTKSLKVSSCLSLTEYHKSNVMTSRINSTPITLQTLKQQNDLASSQKVTLETPIYLTDFAIYDLVGRWVDFPGRRQRGGCCWSRAWEQL